MSEQKHNIIKGLVDGCTDKAIKLNMTHTQMCCCFFFLSILMRSKESRGGGGGGKNENLTTLFLLPVIPLIVIPQCVLLLADWKVVYFLHAANSLQYGILSRIIAMSRHCS